MYYATNDTGDPENTGTVYELVFTDATTATGKVIETGLDDSSGLWYYENNGNRYAFVLESQFGALFGINGFEPPFNIEIIPLDMISSTENSLPSISELTVYPNPFNDHLNFQIDVIEAGEYQLQVFNLNGIIISDRSLQLSEGNNLFQFDGSNLQNGNYYYRLYNQKGGLIGKLLFVK